MALYFNFLIGGISGVFLSDVPADTTEHGSFFVMAHFHYTIMGGLIFAFMGASYYWLPKMMGIKLNQKLGYLHFWTMFIFFNSTFLPLFAVGMLGQPRRVFEYARNLQPLNVWVSISAFLLGGSILIFMINFIWSTVIVREKEVGNPWQSRGLEWQVSSPPPPGNFEHIPVVLSGPYDYGVKDAPPVADLHPPVGVVSAVVRDRGRHRSGGIGHGRADVTARDRAGPGRRGSRLLPRGGAERGLDRIPVRPRRAVLPLRRVRVRLLLPALGQLEWPVGGLRVSRPAEGLWLGDPGLRRGQRHRPVRGADPDQGRRQERLAGARPWSPCCWAWRRWRCRSSSC